jgi:hypothetical protein
LQEKSRIGYQITIATAGWGSDHCEASAENYPDNNSGETEFSVYPQRRDNDGFLLGMRAVSYIDE